MEGWRHMLALSSVVWAKVSLLGGDECHSKRQCFLFGGGGKCPGLCLTRGARERYSDGREIDDAMECGARREQRDACASVQICLSTPFTSLPSQTKKRAYSFF